MKEIWRNIFGYKKFYQISSLGRIKRIKNAGGTWKGRILKPDLDPTGYFKHRLSKYGRTKAFFLHQLLMLSFRKIKKGLHTNHKDGNKLNNRLSNLEQVTPGVNNRHAWKIG